MSPNPDSSKRFEKRSNWGKKNMKGERMKEKKKRKKKGSELVLSKKREKRRKGMKWVRKREKKKSWTGNQTAMPFSARANNFFLLTTYHKKGKHFFYPTVCELPTLNIMCISNYYTRKNTSIYLKDIREKHAKASFENLRFFLSIFLSFFPSHLVRSSCLLQMGICHSCFAGDT